MTKEEIKKKLEYGIYQGVSDDFYIGGKVLDEVLKEYEIFILSEQKEKHEKEMEEFLYWTYKNGWRHSVTPNFFIRVEYPDIVEERVTFTELLTKFKNR